MSDLWQSAAAWLGHMSLAGGVVLGAGWLTARRVSDPARKVAAMGWSVRGAVLAVLLCAMPGWLKLPVPSWAKTEASPPPSQSGIPVRAVLKQAAPPRIESVPPDAWEWVYADRTVKAAREIDIPAFEHGPATVDAAAVAAPPPAVPVPEATGTAGPAADTGVSRLLLIVFSLVGGAAVVQLVAGQFALWRLRRAAKPAPEHVRRLFEMFAPAGQKAPTLLVSDRVAFPVCFGLFRPTVLLPRGLARGADGEVLKWVLAHEMDHLRRGDAWTGLWLAVARACYFFLPWYWAVRKELRLAQEYLADAAAAAAGGNPTEYAAFLVSLTGQPAERRLARHPLGASGVRAKPSDLFRRVHMLVQSGGRIPRTPSKIWSWLTAGSTLGAAVLLSGFGFADDNKPKEKTQTRTIVLDPQIKSDERKVELTVVANSDDDPKIEKRVIEVSGDDNNPKVYRLQGRATVGNAKRVEELKKKIAEAARNGDVNAVRKLADELVAAAGSASGRAVVMQAEPRKAEAGWIERRPEPPKPPTAPAAPHMFTVPAVPHTPAVAGFYAAPVQQEKLKEAMEKGEAKFKEAMEKVQDNPEAKAAMEKAMAEFHRAMAESIKNAPKTPAGNFMKINPDQFQNFGGAQWQPLPGGDGKSFIWQAATKPGEGRLGIVIEKPNDVLVEQLDLPKGQGVIVVQVIKGSPAEKAGIKAKDVLLTLSGKAVSSEPGAAMKMIGGIKKDAKVDVVVIRKGQKETIKGIAIPEGKKVEVRRVEGKAGQGQLEFTLPKDAKIPDDVRKEIEKKIHDAHLQAQKEIERVQRDLPRIQDQARREVERAQREVERAARELPKMQGDLQKQIEQMKAELQKMEQQLNNKGGTTSRGQGEGGSKNKSSSSSMSVSTDGETFSIVATRDSVKYNIGGSLEDGKAVPNRITVKDGDKSYSGTIDKIPAKYRATVKSMLGNVGGGKK